MDYLTSEDIARAAETIRSRGAFRPRVGMILGSGLGALAEEVRDHKIV